MVLAPPPPLARRNRFAVSITLFTLLFVVLEARFFYLQILRGEDYRERARTSVIARERIPPRRGLIKDREGRELARNVPEYGLRVTPHYVERAGGAEVVDRLAALLPLTRPARDALLADLHAGLSGGHRWDPVPVDVSLVADTCPHDGARLELLDAPAAQLLCPEDGEALYPIEAKAAYCPFDRARLRWGDGPRQAAACPTCARRFVVAPRCPDHDVALREVTHNLRCPVCKRTYTDQVAVLKARQHELPGVEVTTALRREYPFGQEAAHALGYMNRVTAEDREAFPGVYELRDVIGRTGVERALEGELRGRPGEALYVRDSQGRRQPASELAGEMEFERAVAGRDVWLTLDMRLQKEVRKAFRYYRSGAAVVVDPRSGEILAMYSKPGFDPNEWSGRLSREAWEAVNENPYTPLIDKAVTPYAPGSVYKIVTGLATLEEGVATPDMTIHCPGFYEFGGRRFHCHNRSGHGPMDLIGAIKHSCDVYFYRVGEMLGMDRLARWGEALGFGAPTGVEIAERTGRVPTRKWHAEHTTLGWQPGFTLSTAIGQGSLTTTPLQVARAFAAVANGGSVLEMHLVRRLVDEEGHVVRQATPTVVSRIPVPHDDLSLIREGLVRVVNDADGTASESALDSIVMAGKTGTAEAAQVRPGASPELAKWLEEDHAWFAAYAPAEDPQVVIVVFVEHGGSGSKQAAPIARRVLQAWMRLGFYHPAGDEDEAALDGEVGLPAASGAAAALPPTRRGRGAAREDSE